MSGPQCCSNPPTLNPSAGAGYVEPLGGLSSYVSGHPDSKLAIILISDVFGYEAPNLRKLADKVAAAGFYVVVPDFFHGDPFVYENADRPLPVWLKDHGTDKGFEDAMPVIEAVKNKGISGVGAAGFCWGAKVVVELAKSELIQAAVLLHPSFVTVDDIKGVKVPTAVLGAEIDKYSPIELLKQFEEVLAAKSEVDGYVKIFPKVSHGWTVRYDVEDEAAVKSAEESHQNLLEWFDKHVKRVGNVKLERRLSSGL
ncbi:endo-1,3;1,4-beta-D-glucanase-like [Juglans regia]|uniref:Endo-1,31,4-beta-D-glucanase-like n=2 Tax=Juglans regia TaxID=51240 RepID=A0A2I4F2X5_JUGRE|nr:endo-1,3;1,4-beta-D-glucanase-like [Juglans regia]